MHMVRMIMDLVGNHSFTLTTGNNNGAGYDASRMAAHRDPFWHPFSSTSTPPSCQPPSLAKIHTVDDLIIMHADGKQWNGGLLLSKDMATTGKCIQTWQFKAQHCKTLSAVFHLNNKEAKRELKVNRNNETLPFCSEFKYLGVTLVRTLTYLRYLESLRKKLTLSVAFLRRLASFPPGCWGNNVANNHLSPGPFNSKVMRLCPVPQCSHLPRWSCHQRRLANCDWMPAPYTSRQSSYAREHWICWVSSQRSHTVSSTTCHGAWKFAPLSAHLSIEWKCTASQIETPICSRRTTIHQLISRQQKKCGSLGG